jgi:hypothetical protein
MSGSRDIFCTGFIADAPDQGTIFPSAGGNSADPKVQAVYWRCLTVLFASARITNPDQRLVLFSNVTPPVVDGLDLARILPERYGVELRRVALTARLARELTPSWGNVLYFFDILASLGEEPDDTRLAVVDSDIVVTGSLAPLFASLDSHDYALYPVSTADDENVNGLSPRQMGAIVGQIRPELGLAPITHFGGEMFACSLGTWRRDAAVFQRLLEDAGSGSGPAAAVRTEEHIYSIASRLLGVAVADAGAQLKRIWTSPRFSTVADGDEALALWHLPAEKRYGFRDMFGALARQGFPAAMDGAAFHALARKLFGIPRKGLVKKTYDGIRQVGAKLGLFG